MTSADEVPDARTAHLAPIVAAERARGNTGGPWRLTTDRGGSTEIFTFRHPLDLAAISAQFLIPDFIHLSENEDGSTSVGCSLTWSFVVGLKHRPSRAARQRRQQWWIDWRAGDGVQGTIERPIWAG